MATNLTEAQIGDIVRRVLQGMDGATAPAV